MKHIGEKLCFSSGREVYASCGIVGMDIFDGQTISGGYDHDITVTGDDDPPWTPEERAELAQHMIGLWTRFGNLPVAVPYFGGTAFKPAQGDDLTPAEQADQERIRAM